MNDKTIGLRQEGILKVGQVIHSMGEQVSVPVVHEALVEGEGGIKTWQPVKEGHLSVRINTIDDDAYINTNYMRQSGVVCFVPETYKGCGILAVRLTYVNRNSVGGIPVDYIRAEGDGLTDGWTGDTVSSILNNFASAKRVTTMVLESEKTEVGAGSVSGEVVG